MRLTLHHTASCCSIVCSACCIVFVFTAAGTAPAVQLLQQGLRHQVEPARPQAQEAPAQAASRDAAEAAAEDGAGDARQRAKRIREFYCLNARSFKTR